MTTYQNAYDEMLDECYPPVKLGPLTFAPSSVIEEMDPTAYRCGFVDWTDSLTCQDCGAEFSADVAMEDEYAPTCADCAAVEV